MMRRLHPTPEGTSRRPFRSLLHGGAIVALSIVLAGTASGATFALWHATATVSSTASSADLELTTSGFDSVSATFANHRLTTTGSFTVTNATVTTSTQQADYDISLSYSGDASLAGKLTVATWPTTDPSGCATSGTTPATAATGTWADFPSDPAQAIAGQLSEQQSASYCVRVAAAERGLLASSAGALAIQPKISATLNLGGWSDTATESTAQATAWIYPAYGPTANTWYQLRNQGSNKCVDVNAAATASGTAIIDFACKAAGTSGDDNQHWKFTRSSGDYYDIAPRNSESLRLDVVTGSTAGAINVVTDTPSRATQEWQVQAQSAGVYQIVNRRSGLCLQPSSTLAIGGNPQYVSVACDGSAAQRFTLSDRGVDVPTVTLVCSTTGDGVSYSWAGGAIGEYAFTAQRGGGGSAISLGSASESEATFAVPSAVINGNDGEYTVTATWNGNPLDTDRLWKTTTDGTSALSCSAPPPPLTALTCTNSGNNNVDIGWGHAAVGAYPVHLRTVQGGLLPVGTAQAGTSSYVVSAGSNWADEVRTLRVSYGSTVAEIEVIKMSDRNNDRLRCLPAPTTLACSADGYNAYFSWPRPDGYEELVSYRVFIGGIQVTDVTRATGWDTTVQFGWRSETAAKYGSGTQLVEVQQSVSGGSWSTVGTGQLVIGTAHGDYLRCGP